MFVAANVGVDFLSGLFLLLCTICVGLVISGTVGIGIGGGRGGNRTPKRIVGGHYSPPPPKNCHDPCLIAISTVKP